MIENGPFPSHSPADIQPVLVARAARLHMFASYGEDLSALSPSFLSIKFLRPGPFRAPAALVTRLAVAPNRECTFGFSYASPGT